MTIERLKRVIWTLQEMTPRDPGIYTNKQVRLAVMEECGTDERTIDANIKKLIELKMMEGAGFGNLRITHKG